MKRSKRGSSGHERSRKEVKMSGALRVGIGGPVGAGKTTLTEALCRAMADTYSLAVISNDIYTREDAEA